MLSLGKQARVPGTVQHDTEDSRTYRHRKGSRAGDTAAKCGEGQDKERRLLKVQVPELEQKRVASEDWEAGRTRPRAGAWEGAPRNLAAQSCVHEYGPECGLDAESSP